MAKDLENLRWEISWREPQIEMEDPHAQMFIEFDGRSVERSSRRRILLEDLLDEVWMTNRLRLSAQQLREVVTIDPDIRGGVPVLSGTRISIAQIFIEISEGESIVEMSNEYGIGISVLKALFEGMATHFDQPMIR